MSRRLDEVDPAAAVAGTWAALTEAAKYSGAGARTAGRRAGRRAWNLASESGDRAALAYQALRGNMPLRRHRWTDLVAVGVVAGAAGAIVALRISQWLARVVAETSAAEAAEEPDAEEAGEPVVRPAGYTEKARA
jgi:hypothetical protein